MLLVKRTASRPSMSGYFLVDGHFRSLGRCYKLLDLISTKPEMIYNPDFLTPTSPSVTFTTIAEVPTFEDFPILYPELFI